MFRSSSSEFPFVFAGLGEAVPGRPPLRRGPPDRLQPGPTAGRGLAAGHKQPLASPPPRPGPPQARACRRRGACALLRPARSLSSAPRSGSRRRALTHRPWAASTSLLLTPPPSAAPGPAARTHTPTAAAAQRAPTQSPPPPSELPRRVPAPSRSPPPGGGPRGARRPLAPRAGSSVHPGGCVGGARLPRVLSNCPLGLPASFPRP